jgi:hypothetical protein
MPKAKFHINFFVGSFILTLLLTAIIWVFWFSRETTSKIMLKQGFDFRLLRLNNETLSEPKIGTKINLASLETSKKEKVSSILSQRLLLFAVVDPLCPACDFSKDMMQDVRKTTNELGIKYLPVVFVKTSPDFDAQKYAETFGFETCVRWSSKSSVPESLSTIVTPSHILTNKDGVILQIWFGSDKKVEVRKRMSEQVSSDLSLINDVVEAIGTNDEIINP